MFHALLKDSLATRNVSATGHAGLQRFGRFGGTVLALGDGDGLWPLCGSRDRHSKSENQAEAAGESQHCILILPRTL